MTPDEITGMLHDAETTPDGPRVWTKDEMRERFMRHVWAAIDEWARIAREGKRDDVRDVLSGLAHSLLALLDGSAVGVPGMLLVPSVHESDEAYHREQGENWWKAPPVADDTRALVEAYDIGGGLHEILYNHDPRRKP